MGTQPFWVYVKHKSHKLMPALGNMQTCSLVVPGWLGAGANNRGVEGWELHFKLTR